MPTFFPAYLPRVMIATRPTLRTRESPLVSGPSNHWLDFIHFIVGDLLRNGVAVDELFLVGLWRFGFG